MGHHRSLRSCEAQRERCLFPRSRGAGDSVCGRQDPDPSPLTKQVLDLVSGQAGIDRNPPRDEPEMPSSEAGDRVMGGVGCHGSIFVTGCDNEAKVGASMPMRSRCSPSRTQVGSTAKVGVREPPGAA